MKTELKYGLIAGIGLSLWAVAEYALGFHTANIRVGKITGYVAMVIPICAIYYGIYDAREKRFKGVITFTEGFKIAIIISLIAAAILTAFYVFYYQILHPNWLADSVAYEKAHMAAEGKSEAEIGKRIAETTRASTLPIRLFTVFTTTMFTNGIMSALTAAVLRQDTPTRV